MRRLLPTSKSESIPVAMRDRDIDEMAAYTDRSDVIQHVYGEDSFAPLTLQDGEDEVGEEASADGYLDLDIRSVLCSWLRKHRTPTGKRAASSSLRASSA